MNIARTAQDLKDLKSKLAGTIAFVPTMGALHEGHLSLVRLGLEKADHVIVSIFVNPTQFAPHEDFDSYPRTEEKDCALLKEAGASVVFLPTKDVIYPNGTETSIKAGAAAKGLESDFRPHFFDGVVNVVYRLFDIVKPDFAIFGEKDYQQLCVIREMVEAQKTGITIIGAPIARDAHGLALSSRNAYLSAGEIEIARTLNITLRRAADRIKAGENEQDVTTQAANVLLTQGFDKIDYIALRDGRILAAAWLGKTRLIDNMAVSCAHKS